MSGVLTEDARHEQVATRTARRSAVLPLAAGAGTLVVVLIALCGPMFAPHSPTQQVGVPFSGPLPGHPLGTDVLGRDVLSRVLCGGRAIVFTALAATFLASVVGGVAGVLAGLASRRTGDLVLRVVDALAVLPALLLILVLAAGFPGSDVAVVVAVALATTPFSVRVLRAATSRIAATSYVEMARVRGDGVGAIMRYDVLPNIAGTALTEAGLRLVASLHLTATAGFLGLGRGAPAPNWGRMVNENISGASLAVAPFLVPTLLLVLLSVCVGLLADWCAGVVSGERS